MARNNELIRVGVVYDGTYFSYISDHYAYQHRRKARISIQGLHEFILKKVADCENADANICRIVEAHYFRGRLPADEAEKRDTLAGDRKFEDVLIRAGVTPHFLLLAMGDGDGPPREKGIDVWLALEAYELASVKHCNVIVLISGDGDHVQLVRKLHSLGARVMVLAWDISTEDGVHQTRTAQTLINAATYSIEMAPLIDGRGRDALVDGMFMPPVGPKPDAERIQEPEAEIRYGTVINVQHGKEFGFIQPEDGGANIHFHFSAVDGDDHLKVAREGTRVSYVPSVNPKSGKQTARNVKYQGG